MPGKMSAALWIRAFPTSPQPSPPQWGREGAYIFASRSTTLPPAVHQPLEAPWNNSSS